MVSGHTLYSTTKPITATCFFFLSHSVNGLLSLGKISNTFPSLGQCFLITDHYTHLTIATPIVFLNPPIGEGTFGLVRQARAEGIVESTPERNIVAVKTTRGKASDPPLIKMLYYYYRLLL